MSSFLFSDSTDRRQVQHACEIANLALDIMTCCSDLEIGRHSTSKLLMKVALHSGLNLCCCHSQTSDRWTPLHQ